MRRRKQVSFVRQGFQVTTLAPAVIRASGIDGSCFAAIITRTRANPHVLACRAGESHFPLQMTGKNFASFHIIF